MDVHLRRVLRHHRLYPVLPQLPDLVLPGARHDHLHGVVPRHSRAHQRPGEPANHGDTQLLSIFRLHTTAMIDHLNAGPRRGAHRPDQAGALLHRRNQHPLHLRWPRRHRVCPPADTFDSCLSTALLFNYMQVHLSYPEAEVK